MDGNKDEALKCLKIGRDSLESGDRTRALKFITKARRLYPSLPLDDHLLSILHTHHQQPPQSSTPLPRRSIPPSGSSLPSSTTTTSVPYTQEQLSIVREIKKKKNYYEILGLEKGCCTVEDVRKAYRKLSLKVHPDKNTAPGAEEAFKSVSKAFQCLSDGESKKKYDISGSEDEELTYHRRPARREGQGFNGFYEADIDAEEIFRNFFFGGTTQFNTSTFSFGPGVGVRMGNNGVNGLVRTLIPVIPVILIMLLNLFSSSEPVYELSRSYGYQHRFTTQNGVNFYVKSVRFEQDYPLNSLERARVEGRVEEDYVSILKHNCRLELQRLQWGLVRETPHCESLKRFQMVVQ